MLKIRLQRVGRIHEPSFRLVLTDSKNSTKSGKYLENLGNFDARRGEKAEFKADRIKHWMSLGAQVTPTVHNLLVEKKIVEGKKINVLPLKKPIIKEVKEVPVEAKTETVVEESAPVAEAPVEESAVETFEEKVAEETLPVAE
ncbi:MAG TPA: 30S ribosomal protein S16 [Candidatus Paceibacterota bacterium]